MPDPVMQMIVSGRSGFGLFFSRIRQKGTTRKKHDAPIVTATRLASDGRSVDYGAGNERNSRCVLARDTPATAFLHAFLISSCHR